MIWAGEVLEKPDLSREYYFAIGGKETDDNDLCVFTEYVRRCFRTTIPNITASLATSRLFFHHPVVSTNLEFAGRLELLFLFLVLEPNRALV